MYRPRLLLLLLCVVCLAGGLVLLHTIRQGYFIHHEQQDDQGNYEEGQVDAEEEEEEEEEALGLANLWWPNDSVENRMYWTNLGYFSVFYNEQAGPDDHLWIGDHTVTLVLVVTIDRVSLFHELTKRWEGPIACVLYVEKLVADYQLLQFKHDFNMMRSSFSNVRMHIVVGEEALFPYNRLRNLAWDIVQTPWLVLWESEYLPSRQVFPVLDKFGAKSVTEKTFIIPSFETQCFFALDRVPEPKDVDFLPPLRRYRGAEEADNVTIWDDEDYFAGDSKEGERFHFVNSRQIPSMLRQCIIRRPVHFNSPTDYATFYIKAVQRADSIAMGGDVLDAKMYFGYTPLLMIPTSSERPLNEFILKKDAIAQHVMSLHRESPGRFMTMPFPVYAYRVSNEYGADKFAGLETSPELLCQFREAELRLGNSDFLCQPRAAEYRDRMPCCASSTESQQLSKGDTIPVLKLPNAEGDQNYRPNWQRLIGTV